MLVAIVYNGFINETLNLVDEKTIGRLIKFNSW